MEYLDALLARYKSKGVIIDTNLLLMYFVGMYDPHRVPKFKRTMTFAVEDFYTLLGFFDFFDKIVTTPNILTEVNSLAGQLPNDIKALFSLVFASQLDSMEEHYTNSTALTQSPHFSKFGLTDSGIVDLAQGRYLVLTDDLRLFGYLQNVGIDAINFNQIRTLNWKL
jgi:rRNA-processing protein FCF1